MKVIWAATPRDNMMPNVKDLFQSDHGYREASASVQSSL